MIFIGRITKVGEAQTYTSRTGETKTLRRVCLTQGADSMAATALGEMCTTVGNMPANTYVVADVSMSFREWQSQQGGTQQSTDVLLNRIAPL